MNKAKKLLIFIVAACSLLVSSVFCSDGPYSSASEHKQTASPARSAVSDSDSPLRLPHVASSPVESVMAGAGAGAGVGGDDASPIAWGSPRAEHEVPPAVTSAPVMQEMRTSRLRITQGTIEIGVYVRRDIPWIGQVISYPTGDLKRFTAQEWWEDFTGDFNESDYQLIASLFTNTAGDITIDLKDNDVTKSLHPDLLFKCLVNLAYRPDDNPITKTYNWLRLDNYSNSALHLCLIPYDSFDPVIHQAIRIGHVAAYANFFPGTYSVKKREDDGYDMSFVPVILGRGEPNPGQIRYTYNLPEKPGCCWRCFDCCCACLVRCCGGD